MTPSAQHTIIKRHANQRLYNTRSGKYVSRRHLEELASKGDNFIVLDAVTGDDITRSVLGQIAPTQQMTQDQLVPPSELIRRVMSFYGDTLRTLMTCYMDLSLLILSGESVHKQMKQAGHSVLGFADEQAKRNIRLFEAMVTSFASSMEAQRQKPSA